MISAGKYINTIKDSVNRFHFPNGDTSASTSSAARGKKPIRFLTIHPQR